MDMVSNHTVCTVVTIMKNDKTKAASQTSSGSRQKQDPLGLVTSNLYCCKMDQT